MESTFFFLFFFLWENLNRLNGLDVEIEWRGCFDGMEWSFGAQGRKIDCILGGWVLMNGLRWLSDGFLHVSFCVHS